MKTKTWVKISCLTAAVFATVSFILVYYDIPYLTYNKYVRGLNFLSREEVSAKWNQIPFDSEKFKEGTMRIQMTAELLEPFFCLNKSQSEIESFLGPSEGFEFHDEPNLTYRAYPGNAESVSDVEYVLVVVFDEMGRCLRALLWDYPY